MFFIFLSLSIAEVLDYDMGISVDCGSSQTTLYIYAWNTSFQFPLPAILYKASVSQSVRTAYYDNTIVDTVFSQLLKDANNFFVNTPYEMYRNFNHSNIDFLAYFTGVRNLEPSEQKEVITRSLKYVQAHSDFNVTESFFQVITPVQEAIYTWITVNLITQKMTSKDTFPVVSMGSSTVSLVATLTGDDEEKFVDNKFEIEINNNVNKVYCFVFDNFGFDTGIANHTRSLAANLGRATVESPCYLKNTPNLQIGQIDVEGESNMTYCDDLLSQYTLIRNGASCSSTDYCTFNNVQIPFPLTSQIYATGVFAYAADAFQWADNMTLQQQIDFADDYCSKSFDETTAEYPNIKESYRKLYCAQMAYTNKYLRDGFGVPLTATPIRETSINMSIYEPIPLDYLYGAILSVAYGGILFNEMPKKFPKILAIIISVVVGLLIIGIIVFVILKIKKKNAEIDEKGEKELRQRYKEDLSNEELLRREVLVTNENI